MQSSEPMPGNPWPHDMRIDVTDGSFLPFLLFVRSAWQLDANGVPPLEAEPDVGRSARPSDVEPDVNDRWLAEWRRVWTQFEPRNREVRAPDAVTLRMLETASDEELWEAYSHRPSDYWEPGIDREAFVRWSSSLQDDHTLPLEQHPERLALPALINAWQTGLTSIVQLPYAGYFAERINREHLVVSALTRRNTALYSRALSTPQAGAGQSR